MLQVARWLVYAVALHLETDRLVSSGTISLCNLVYTIVIDYFHWIWWREHNSFNIHDTRSKPHCLHFAKVTWRYVVYVMHTRLATKRGTSREIPTPWVRDIFGDFSIDVDTRASHLLWSPTQLVKLDKMQTYAHPRWLNHIMFKSGIDVVPSPMMASNRTMMWTVLF